MRRLKKILSQYLRERWMSYLWVLLLYFSGYILGALGPGALDAGQKQQLTLLVDHFWQNLSSLDVDRGRYFWSLVLEQGRSLFLLFLGGLFVLTLPLVWVVVFLRGFALGFTAAFLTAEKAAAGAVLALVALLPQNLFFLSMYWAAAVSSQRFALYWLKSRLGRRQGDGRDVLLAYFLVFLLYGGLLFLGALTETYFTPVLMKQIWRLLN
ncbi:stage II sporulation protein M [Carboxydocella thermautotrophica]|nr:stage II sporulation protein M [Carboxydocella thermautotrophica]